MDMTTYAPQTGQGATAQAFVQGTAAELGKTGAMALKIIHRKWTNRRARREFASLNDHMLREIGIHRSELTVVTEETFGVGAARFYK